MKEWKQAYQVAKLELTHSIKGFFFYFIFLMFILSFLATSLESYIDNDFMGYDFFFIFLFFMGGFWAKPKVFQSQKQALDVLVSPTLIMQLQLPIKQDVLIKSRFIIYFCYSLPWQVIFLILFYYVSPINEMLSISAYIAFSVIWLSTAVYVGTLFPMSDAGERGFAATTIGTIIIAIMVLFLMFIAFLGIYFFTDHGFVYWSIVIAKKWPFLASILSIGLAGAALQAHQIYMKKIMNKLDYI
ncbi:hypothetical protein JUJ52_07885 [Virgibacillus sp. AGTR]|uniref:hypothetical protein n=1 Tax=Virgibacillus sp. AGTR TaxID=2812055 RepID=UPI001964A3E6|nr:hypothetical protein [Virgibacillus sp. AGTR]MCC2249886.1 hypothetical protein [Virgibacillus sp. AGTR]QRZ18660.1 hypothetical protein JUJ52_02595 [Virgibacillus sp. AGTR]